jgi:hypothetical protein
VWYRDVETRAIRTGGALHCEYLKETRPGPQAGVPKTQSQEEWRGTPYGESFGLFPLEQGKRNDLLSVSTCGTPGRSNCGAASCVC